MTPAPVEPWNQAKWEELRDCGVPQYWLIVTPVECAALLDGIVSASIQEQCRILAQELPRPRDAVYEASKASVERQRCVRKRSGAGG